MFDITSYKQGDYKGDIKECENEGLYVRYSKTLLRMISSIFGFWKIKEFWKQPCILGLHSIVQDKAVAMQGKELV